MIEIATASKMPTMVAIPVLALATVMGWAWLWGLLFLYWALLSLRSGEAFLVEPIARDRNAVLFWAITATWAGFGLWTMVEDLSTRLA